MADLAEVSYYTRKAVKWGAIGLVVILLAPVVWRGIRAVYLKIWPPPPPPPTVAYGSLPQLAFPPADKDYQPVLRLETIDGKLPKLPPIGNVYVVNVNKSRLLELDRVKARVKSLGFTAEPQEVDEQTYKFVHPVIPATLTVDVIYNSYQYRYDWTLDQELYAALAVPNADQAFLEAKSFFQALGVLGSDLASGKPRVAYFAAQPPQMVPTGSLSEANFIRVDLWRSDRDDLPWVTTRGDISPVNITFSGVSDRSKKVVEANLRYSQVIEGNLATYPLKTVDQAWNELQQGQGHVAIKAGSQVIVRQVYLAYYEADGPQEFVQPVYVFAGDGGYLAYIEAIDPAYQQDTGRYPASPNLSTPK